MIQILTDRHNKGTIYPESGFSLWKGIMSMRIASNALKKTKKRLARHFDAKLFFMHIPKCGGTSVDNAIRLHRHKKRPWHQFHMHSEAAAVAARRSNMKWKPYNETLLLYAMANPQTSYITGHFFFS